MCVSLIYTPDIGGMIVFLVHVVLSLLGTSVIYTHMHTNTYVHKYTHKYIYTYRQMYTSKYMNIHNTFVPYNSARDN